MTLLYYYEHPSIKIIKQTYFGLNCQNLKTPYTFFILLWSPHSQWILMQMNNITQNKNKDQSPPLGIPKKLNGNITVNNHSLNI